MNYLLNNLPSVGALLLEHLWLTMSALAFALAIALPLGILAARVRMVRGPLLGMLGVIYTIPSLSLFVLLIPLLRLGYWPAVVALTLYAQVVLVRNILLGLTTIDPAVIEAARGMGMNSWQRLVRVELPLALPLIFAGVRIATLSTIGIATIAAFINAGGLGTLLFDGVRSSNPEKIIAGAIAVAALAFAANGALWLIERRVTHAVYGAGA
jgi:osmoprotectant transport system permease protein